MNGFTKIARWLEDRGYSSKHIRYDSYRHYDSFHKGEIYHVDVYGISNGLYVLVKADGKPRYILSRTDTMTGHMLIDFSQGHFIKRLEQTEYFKKG